MGCLCHYSIWVIVVGVVVVALGVILGWAVFPPIVESQIKENVILRNGTDQWDRWVDIPLPITFKVFVFHVENPDDVMNGASPNLTEIGPYVYKQTRHKFNITQSNKSTLVYYQNMHFEFDTIASYPRTLNDIVTVLNTPMNAVFQIAETDPSLSSFLPIISTYYSNVFNGAKSLFATIKVREFLFDGYHFCEDTGIFSRQICKRIGPIAPKEVVALPDGSYKFSFLSHKQDQHDGLYRIKDGEDEFKLLGQITEWERAEYQQFWGNEENECNRVHGTDATLFPPLLKKNDMPYFYITDICRSININYQEEVEFKKIKAYRFTLTAEAMAAPNETEGTQCYCLNMTRGGDLDGENGCMRDGAVDLYTCHGAPIVLTLPHFLHADESYSERVEGLTPDPEKHVTYVDLEPNTGTPLRGYKRVQFNMFIRPVQSITVTKNLSPTLFPMIWIEEGVELNDELRQVLQESFFDIMKILTITKYTLIGVGAAITLCGIILLIRKPSKTETV